MRLEHTNCGGVVEPVASYFEDEDGYLVEDAVVLICQGCHSELRQEECEEVDGLAPDAEINWPKGGGMSKPRTWWAAADSLHDVPMRVFPSGYIIGEVEVGIVSEIETWTVERIKRSLSKENEDDFKDFFASEREANKTHPIPDNRWHDEYEAGRLDGFSSVIEYLDSGDWKENQPKEESE